jgi:hypothetical protein
MAKFTSNELNPASARLRSSLVSAAVIKGILIPGPQSSMIQIKVSLSLQASSDSIVNANYIFLNRGTTFKGANDTSDSRILTLLSPYKLIKISEQSGIVKFEGYVVAYEGQLSTYRFLVDDTIDNQRFLINGIKMDSRQSKVFYYNADAETLISEFQNVDTLQSGVLTPGSNLFKIVNHDTKQVEFIFPTETLLPNRILAIEYLSTIGELGNGVFTISSFSNHGIQNADISSVSFSISSPSSQGAESPSIDNIRDMILNYTSSQRRVVTKYDVISAIKTRWSAMTDVNAWSGKDHTEKSYGRVYCSAKGVKNMSISYPIANTITDYLVSIAVDGLDIEFIQPFEILCDSYITAIVDKQKSFGLNESSVVGLIQAAFTESFYENSTKFNSSIDHSKLINAIKTAVPQLLSVQFNHTFVLNSIRYKTYFDNAITSVEITNAKYNETSLLIYNDNNGNLYAYDAITGNKVFSFPIGTVSFNTGEINISRTDLIKIKKAVLKITSKFSTIRVFRNNFLKPNNIDVTVVYG